MIANQETASARANQYGETCTYRFPKRYRWEPKPDITAFELALLMPCMSFNAYDTEAALAHLSAAHGPAILRHVEEIL